MHRGLTIALIVALMGCTSSVATGVRAERAGDVEPLRFNNEPWVHPREPMELYAPRGWTVLRADLESERARLPASILEDLPGAASVVAFDPASERPDFIAVLMVDGRPTYEGWLEDSRVFLEAIYSEMYPGFSMLLVDSIAGRSDTLLVKFQFGEQAQSYVEERHELGGAHAISVTCVAREASELGHFGWCRQVAERVRETDP